MKYIRTEDEIIKVDDEDSECYYFHNLKDFLYKDEIIKESDSIEELSDFIIYDNDIFWNKIYTFSNNSKEIQNSSRRVNINKESIKKGIYYAIWTKGENKEPILKSVAKLNDNGVELIEHAKDVQ